MVQRTNTPVTEEFGPTVGETGDISFTLDGRPVRAQWGETIWHAARRHGVNIPHGCLSSAPDFRPDGNCRLCVVEVEGYRTLQPSCLMKVSEGMVVHTDTTRAIGARRLVMELLQTEAAIDPGSECGRVVSAMAVAIGRFPPPETHALRDESHPGIVVDLSKCIRCMRCVQACREIEVNNVIGMAGRGWSTHVVFDFDDPMGKSTCVSCGACAQACPTGAIVFRVPSDGP